MNRKHLISLFFIVLLLYILFNVIYILSPFLNPIFWASMITFAFYPFYQQVLKRIANTTLSSLVVTLVVFLAAAPLAILCILVAIKEVVHFYEWLSQFIQSGGAERFLQGLREISLIKRLEEMKLIQWDTLKTQLEDIAINSAGSIGNFVLKNATILTKNVITGLFNFLLTFFLIFFLLRDGDKVVRFIREITPLDEETKDEIFHQLSETFSATLRGQILTSLAQAAVLGLVFWILRLPLPGLFAGIAFLASMIPLVGVSSVWVPFCIYLFIGQEYVRATALLALGALVISGIDNVLKPLVIGQKTKLPYSLLFIGILGGIQVYGVMGVFLAPAMLTLFFVLIRIFQRKFYTD